MLRTVRWIWEQITKNCSRKKEEGLLHKAFLENDVDNLSFLAASRPGLDPYTIKYAIDTYQSFKTDPRVEVATPLLSAVIISNQPLCEYLIQEGADLNAGIMTGMNPLSAALHQEQYDIVKLLIRTGADLHSSNSKGETPMCYAIKEGTPVEIVSVLLSAGACIDASIDPSSHDTLLSKAVKCGNIPVIKFLIEQGVNVNKRVGRTTALNIAVTLNLTEVAEILVKNGAFVEGGYDDFPPSFLAVRHEDAKILTMLIQNGADVNRKCYPARHDSRFGNCIGFATLLHLAVQFLCYQVVKVLLDCGANVNATDEFGRTPFLLLVSHDESRLILTNKITYQKIINIFLERRAGLCAQNQELQVVHVALQLKNWTALSEIVQFGFDVNQSLDEKNNISMFHVGVNENKVLASLCLKYGANFLNSIDSPMMGLCLPIEIAMIRCDPFLIRIIGKHTFTGVDCPNTKYQSEDSIFKKYLSSELKLFEGIRSNSIQKIKDAFSESKNESLVTNGKILGFRNALSLPIMLKNNETVELLLKKGVQPTTLYEDAFTDLHVATLVQNFEAFKSLLSFGSCYNYKSVSKITPRQIQNTVDKSPNEYFVIVREKPKQTNVLNTSTDAFCEVEGLELCLNGTELSFVFISEKKIVDDIFLKCITSTSDRKLWTSSQEYLQARVPLNTTIDKILPTREGNPNDNSKREKPSSGKKIKRMLSFISRVFSMVRKGQKQVLTVLEERKGSEEFLCYINCVNRRGNTLMGEALQHGHTEIAEGIMTLRLTSTE